MSRLFTYLFFMAICFLSCNTQQEKIVEEEKTIPAIVHPKSHWAETEGINSILYNAETEKLVAQKQAKRFAGDGPAEMAYTLEILDSAQLQKLGTKALLWYCLAYPCSYEQNCMAYANPKKGEMRLYPQLPGGYTAYRMSSLQWKILNQRKDSVEILLHHFLANRDSIHPTILNLASDLRLYNLVPLICQKADTATNIFCYTLLMDLMVCEAYKPFSASDLCTRIYTRHEDGVYRGAMVTAKETAYIREQAMEFYQSKK